MKHIFLALSAWAELMGTPPLGKWDTTDRFYQQLNWCWYELGNQECTDSIANARHNDWYWFVLSPILDPLDKGRWTTNELDEDPAMW